MARGGLELTSAITAVASLLASCLTLDELTLLAAILVELSDTLNTLVVHRTLCGEEGEPRN